MNSGCLQYCLTDHERDFFEQSGYLVVKQALDSKRIERLLKPVDRLYFEADLRPGEFLFHDNFLCDDLEFLKLIDYPKVFPKIWGILGWNIYIYHTHLIVTPKSNVKESFGWHQDGNQANFDMTGTVHPRLSVKVAYFLSDATTPICGNFYVVPGSHLQVQKPDVSKGIPVCVEAGDVIIFDRRVWHSASANQTENPRKVLFYGYAHRWLQPKDEMNVPKVTDPVQKQLLGFKTCANGLYKPSSQDVPLRDWLIKNNAL